jgi:ABC-2 type transport system permease protein
MNSPLIPESDFPRSSEGLPAPSANRPLYWSVRRELMENRFLYLAPLIVAAVVLFGSFMTLVTMPHRKNLRAQDPATQSALVMKPISMAPAPIMLATILIGVFYSLDALYGERRDRSILFWKSMPVSDLTTVLSKASIPLVVLPVIALALSALAQVALIVLTTPVLIGNGVSPAALGGVHFFEGLVIMFYGLTAHMLWFAPIYAWLILISAWARRSPLLWAVLPPLVVMMLERMAFGTSHFASMLGYRVTGAMKEAFSPSGQRGDVHRLAQLDPAGYLSAPGLWVGLIAAAAFLAAAVRLRKNREPI